MGKVVLSAALFVCCIEIISCKNVTCCSCKQGDALTVGIQESESAD